MPVKSLTEASLKALIADICRVDPAIINTSTRFVADLKMDSLASLDLLTELEEEWEIEVTQEDARDIRTYGELWAFIQAQ
jgi:acyl carrier protein